MSLYDELKNASARDGLRLHTPGHKGRLCDLDLTELIDGSFPSGHIAAAESRIASVYGAKHAHMLCGGSSQGVKSAVYFADRGGVVDINSHRSVFDGFKLSCKRCVTVGRRGGVYPITVKEIENALTPETQAVAVTTPTYYGFCADVPAVSEFCRRRGLLFIADSAHGAHFGFCDRLPKSVAPYCDICNVSTHKTLSALTQTALLLDNLSEDGSAKLRNTVALMGTTSPSYLLYSSIERSVEDAVNASARYDALYEPIAELKRKYAFLKNDDFTRLVLDCAASGADCAKLNAALCRRGVFGEMTDGRHIVFIFTAADEPSAVIKLDGALRDALSEIQ